MEQTNTRRGFTQIKNSVIPNLIWNLQRLSLQLINYRRGRSRIKYGMTPLCNNSAFTLIELLVAVLIIGILAAVAVPKYQKIIQKNTVMKILPIGNSVEKSMDVFILEEGYPEEKVYFTGNRAPYVAPIISIPGPVNNFRNMIASDFFTYGFEASCTSTQCTWWTGRWDFKLTYTKSNTGEITRTCVGLGDKAALCKMLEPMGWHS